MGTLLSDTFSGSGSPDGRTPDTTDPGSNWTQLGDDATMNVQSGYCGITGLGTDTNNESRFNPLVCDVGDANVVIEAVVWDKSSNIKDGPGVMLRAGADTTEGIYVRMSADKNTLIIEKRTGAGGGTRTELANESVTLSKEVEYTLSVTANGSAISADLYDSGSTLLQSVSATETDYQSNELHGICFGRANSVAQRCMSVTIGDIGLNATVDENGFDITADATSTSTANYTVKVGSLGTESAATIQSVIRTSPTKVRIRLANGERVLSGDSVLVSSTADGITDNAATNDSAQVSNKIVEQNLAINFSTLSEADVGITAGGVLQYAGSNHPASATYTPGTGEEQYRFVACMKNPEAGADARQAFHEDEGRYDSSAAFTLGGTPATGDQLMFGVAYPTDSTHSVSTPYSLGDVIREGSNWYRCTAAGTTAGTKPTFTDVSVPDNEVTWERDSESNNSAVRKVVRLQYSGSSLRSQASFAYPFTDGATAWDYTTADIDADQLAGDAAVAGQESIVDLTATCRYSWYEIGYLYGTYDGSNAFEQMGTFYGRDISRRANDIIQALHSDASYTDELLHLAIQRGIDQIGMREGGGYWQGLEGFSAGRLSLPLFAGAVLGAKAATLAAIKTPASGRGNPSTVDWRGYGEIEQAFYVGTTDHDATMQGGYDYFNGNGGTWVNPANAPSTYGSDGPAGAYFPATIQDSWEFVPEWGPRNASDPTGTVTITTCGPRWDAGNPYRLCCTSITQGVLEYLIYVHEYETESGFDAFLDWHARYEGIESADPSHYDATYKTLRDTHLDTHRPAYGVESSSLDGATLTVIFNRYTTGTDAAWQTAVAGSGSTTCTGATQTGPRTWEFTLSGAPASGETVDYTAASGDAVDAENNALPDSQLIQPAELLPATTPGAGAIAGSTTITLTYSEPIENTISPLPAADITVSNAATGNAELVTENPIVSGSTITIVYEGDPAATDAVLTVSLNNGDNHVLTVSNGLPIASLSGEVVSVIEAVAADTSQRRSRSRVR